MGFVSGVIGGIGDAISSVVGAVVDLASDVIKGVGNAISGVVDFVGKTVEGILKDPLPTLLQIGGAMVGIPPYVTAAVITAAKGGDLEDMAKSAAISYATTSFMSDTQIGADIKNYTSNAWAGDFTDAMMENFNLPADTAVQIAKVATSSMNSALVGGINAALTGKPIGASIASGFTSGLVYASTDSYFDSLNKDPNWGFSSQALNLMKGATSTTLNTIVSGKGDPSQALGNYIAYATINLGGTTLANAAKDAYKLLTTDTNAAKGAQDKYTTAKAEYDTKVTAGEKLRNEINADAAAYDKKITDEFNPFKTSYDALLATNTGAVNTFNDQKKIFDDNKWAYENYDAKLRGEGWTGSADENGSMVYYKRSGGHYEDRQSYDEWNQPYTYKVYLPDSQTITGYDDNGPVYSNSIKWDFTPPTKDSFATAANAAGVAANAAAEKANSTSTEAKTLYDNNKTMLDSIEAGKTAIDKKVADLTVIRTDIEDASVVGSTAATLKAAADAYQTKYDAWAKTKGAADQSAENYTKALAEVATRDATIDALNTNAISVTSKDADGNWNLSNGMTLTTQGKFMQDGAQVFTNAAGIPQKVMDFKAADGSNVDFDDNAGRLLSETDVVNICKRDYGFTPTPEEIDRLSGTSYSATGSQDITALADQKATSAYRSVTGTDPTEDELAAIKKTRNVVGSAISLAKTGDADPWGDLEGAMLKGSSGEAVKFTDAQLTDMVRKSLIFEGGDYNTKQDAANAARLAGYTQFEYDTSVYTMQPGGPTEKDLFQAVINDAPNKKEAFRLARSLLGANQIFDYKGNKITTETMEERNARQYNSDAAIQARVDLIPASGGSINTRTGTPANVSNTFIDQKTNKVVEDTRVWNAAGDVVSGSLSVADQSRALQVAGSLILDAGTQMAEAFTGVGKFLGLIDKDSTLAKNVNKLVSFNEAQKPPEVKAESAQFWADVKNAQGIGNTIDVVLSSVVDKPLMTGFNIASEIIQTVGTLGAGAGVKYASTLLKAAPSIAAKLGIGTDAVLNIGESAGASYNESYKKALSSVGAQVRDGSMTAADAEAYAEDTASKTFLAAAGITGAVMLLPGGNALAKQVLGSSAENAAMKTTFKEAIKSDAAKVGYKFAAGTTAKETISEGGEAALIEGASQKILSPDADYNWKDIVVTTMLESIYGGGHSAVIAAADVAVSNFKDKLIASGVDQTEVEGLTKKVADLVKSGNVSDASIAALKTETENLFENVDLRVDPTLDLMSDQFLSGVISQEVAGELSASGLSAKQIAENLPNAIAHVESGNKIDPTYIDPFLTDDAEARQIAQSLGYTNPSQEVLNSLTGPISEADSKAKLVDFLDGVSALQDGAPISAADAQEIVKDLGLTSMSDADAINLATKIVQSVPADKLAPDPNIQLAKDAGFPDVATYTQYGGDKAAYDKVQTDNANVKIAIAAGFPDFATYTQYGGNADAYNKAKTDAANLTTAQAAGFPNYASYAQFNGDVSAYNKVNEDAANIRKATEAGFPDYATFLQYNGKIADYTAAKTAETNKKTATDAGFPDFNTYTQYGGDKTSYTAAVTAAANTKLATEAGFPDFATYTQYGGNADAFNTANANAANLTTAKAAGFPDYATYTQYKGDVTAYNNAITAAANAQKATDAGFPDYATYTQYNGNKAVYTAALSDASNTALATKAGFPDFNTYTLYGGNKNAYDTALTNTANTQKATAAGFPNYAAYTQYNGDVKAYNADSAAKIAGWKDAAEQTKANTAGYTEPAAYATYLTNTANTQKATTAGFPDYGTYTQFNGDLAAYNASKLTDETTKAINNAIAGIQFPAGITAADVAAQVKAALAANPNLTVADVTGSITAYMTANPGLSAADVNTAIAAATKDLATKKDIETAISGITFPAGLSKADVAAEIKAAMDANPGLSAADVTSAITTYMEANPGLSAADVSTAIGTATKDLVSTKTFNTAIESLGSDVKTKFDALTQGQKDIVKAYTQQGVDINKAINDSAKLNTEQITNVKTQLTALTGDVKIKFDALTKSQQDIVTSQVQLGVDLNKAIDDAAKATSEQITNVRTDLTRDITDVQTQFNTRVDELVLQGKTYQEATQEALKELGTGVSGLQTNVADIKKQQDAEAKAKKAAEDKAKTQGGLSAAMSLIAPAAASAVSDDTPYRQIGLKTTGDSKFEGPLEQYLKMVREGDYSPKPKQQDTPQQNQQVAPVQDELSTPQPQPQEGSDYFNYGQQTDINDLLGGGKAPELPFKAGGLATPLFAGGGTTRHGRYAGGGLNVIHHSGKPRLDFRTGNAVTGPGDGQSDDIPAMLADGEFVFPADVVAALGNGSTKAGSDKLYDMMHSIRAYHRSAKPKDLPPPAKKSPLDYLKKRTARR